MTGRFHNKTWILHGSRFVSCAVVWFCLFALVGLPALHLYVFDHCTENCNHCTGICTEVCEEHAPSDSGHVPDPDSEDNCPVCKEYTNPVCKADRQTTFYFVSCEPILLPTCVVTRADGIVSTPLVAYATVLPPCRAPPVV